MAENEFTCACNVVHEDVVREVSREMLAEPLLGLAENFFKVFGDATRLRIIWALDQHELCVCDLASVLGMTKSAVSHQLAVLRKAALVKFRRDGKTVFYSLDDDHVKKVLEAGIEHVCE